MYDEPWSFKDENWYVLYGRDPINNSIQKEVKTYEPQPFYHKQECMNVRRPKRKRMANRIAKQARKLNR